MPSSISLHALSYATPDGHSLFADLDLTFGPERTGLVGRNGVGKSTLLKLIEGTLLPLSGSVHVDGRLGFLRQSVQVSPDDTIADAMGAGPALALLARAEAGTADLDELAEADWTLLSRMEAALARTGLGGFDIERPFETLSGGQRTRVALAALLLDEPDIIILDEPTNNLDAEGRQAVAELLRTWRGGAIVVSHDRTLLGAVDNIVELTTLGATSYGGNWEIYRERKALELASARQSLATAERKVGEIDRRIQAQKERKAKKDAAGQRKADKGDIPRIMLGGMKENAENSSGEGARLANKMRQQASDAAAEARAQIEVLEKVSLRVPSTNLPAGKIVLRAEDISGGPVPEQPVIKGFSMVLTGPERVAITGPNGVGKSTLLRLIMGLLPPISGNVQLIGRHAFLDQTVSLLDPTLSIRDNFRALNPGSGENECRAALARFLFRAEAALQIVGQLSGGETLRAGLACVLGGASPPELLILDEPTNHLDIEAIEAVEAGLRAYDGALLVVSHDRAFLSEIGIEREVDLSAPGG